MSESLTSRVGRIIAGGFHTIVDAVERAGPESVMEQAIREIDTAIADVRSDLGSVEAQRHLTGKRLAEDSARLDTLGEQAREALAQQRDDLAGAAVERQIDIEAQLPILEARLTELAEQKTKLEGFITALQAKKREMRDALAEFRTARAQQSSPTGTATSSGRQGESVQARGDRAAEAFDRIFQRETGLRGTSGTADTTAAKLAELEELARRNRIAERLAQLKAGQA
jgi:phage shock protein A